MNRLACVYAALFLVVWPWEARPPEVWAAVTRISVEELAREAELIAVVRVLTVQDMPGTSLATATLQLREVLKAPPGFAARSIEVRFPSPRVPPGTSRRVISTGPTYQPGELAVVFLKASADGRYFETVRTLLGKRTISQDRIAFEDISLDAFLSQIRAAVSPPSVLPDGGQEGRR